MARQSQRIWDLDLITSFLCDIGYALEFLHCRGFAHCNVTLQNIYVCDGNAYLGGLDMIECIGVTHVGVQKYSRYLPPELHGFGPHRITEKTDIFAFGCVALQMLTHETAMMNGMIEFNDFAIVVEQLPFTIRSVIRSCLNDDPALRPSILELLADLEPLSIITDPSF
jgi:serine/threonine protein kinase